MNIRDAVEADLPALIEIYNSTVPASPHSAHARGAKPPASLKAIAAFLNSSGAGHS